MTLPKAVFGLPMFNQVEFLAEALESLLTQSRPDLAIVVVDDSTYPEPARIVQEYAQHDPRISYFRNPVRLGLIGNWRKAFETARKLYPQSPYFAWASDHDAWHPQWLEAMVEAMEEHPDIVLAYPFVTYVIAHQTGERGEPEPDTLGLSNRAARLRRSSLKTSAGNAVYGLFRAPVLERAGVFRAVLRPDRLLMAELSIYGQFKVVPEYLWLRRRTARFSIARQRTALFGDQPPRSALLPWPIVHAWVLIWELVVCGAAAPYVGWREGLPLSAEYFVYMLIRVALRWNRGLRSRYRRALRARRRLSSRRQQPHVLAEEA